MMATTLSSVSRWAARRTYRRMLVPTPTINSAFLNACCIRIDGSLPSLRSGWDESTGQVRSVHYSSCLLAKSKDRGKDKKVKRLVHLDEAEMDRVIDVVAYKEKLEKALEEMKRAYAEQVSLRSASASFSSIKVNLEGDTYPLNEIAQISFKNPQLVIVNCTAFPQATQDVMKALLNSGMNLNPQQDGTTIYVPVPRVTMEHREQLAKNAKQFFNRCKDSIRELRNRHVAQVKKNSEHHSADLVHSVEEQVHAMSEQYAHKAEEILKAKQAELLNVK